MPRFNLRTLLLVLTTAPFLIALAYWSIEYALGGKLKVQVYLALLALSAYSCLAGWRGLNVMLFGPTPEQTWRRKKRRHIRVRIGRLVGNST